MFRYLICFFLLCLSLSSDEYLPTNDPMLKTPSKLVPVEAIRSSFVRSIIKRLQSTANIERTNGHMVGLAAPQIGIDSAIVMVDTGFDESGVCDFREPMEIFINPEVVWFSEDDIEYNIEGCYSSGDLVGLVPRYSRIILAYHDLEGNRNERQFEGFVARIVQHEVDHINGTLFPDRMTDFDQLHFVKKCERDSYRDKRDSWTKKCSREEWKQIRDGGSCCSKRSSSSFKRNS